MGARSVWKAIAAVLVLSAAVTLVVQVTPASAATFPNGCITENAPSTGLCPSHSPQIVSADNGSVGTSSSGVVYEENGIVNGSPQNGSGEVASLGGLHLNAPIVGVASLGATGSFLLAASDGGVFALNAAFWGSMAGQHLRAPIVGIVARNDDGYWLVAADGGVFSYGDMSDSPEFYGSLGGIPLNAPIVGMAPTPDYKGYWLVAADGGVFAFGDAAFYGSMGGQRLDAPIVGMASSSGGQGYWLVGSDGGVFTYGDAPFYGADLGGGYPVIAIADFAPTACLGIDESPCPDQYVVALSNGQVYRNSPFSV